MGAEVLWEQISGILHACGIPLCGVCAFSAVHERLLPCAAARRLPENARSVVMCAFPYLVEHGDAQEGANGTPEPVRGGDVPRRNLSRYAVVPDYHAVCGDLLEQAAAGLREQYPGAQFVPFVDNSPIPEVYAAARAGLGVVGDNGLLITENYGSWVFLGELVTDLALDGFGRASGPGGPEPDSVRRCEHCGACAAACPSASGLADKTKCLSRLTQQKRELDEDSAARIARSGCVWGCDACQACCPHNRAARCTQINEFLMGARPVYRAGDDPAGRAYAWRPQAVIERNLRLVEGKTHATGDGE